MKPARSFGPDVAIGGLSTWWVHLIGPVAGAVIAAGLAYVLRGPAKAQEAKATEEPSGSADIGGITVHPAQGVTTLTAVLAPRATPYPATP